MTFKLKLPCYYATEKTEQLELIGIDADLDYCEVKEVILYEKPFLLSPYVDNGIERGSKVCVGNDYILSPLMVSEIEKIIDNL